LALLKRSRSSNGPAVSVFNVRHVVDPSSTQQRDRRFSAARSVSRFHMKEIISKLTKWRRRIRQELDASHADEYSKASCLLSIAKAARNPSHHADPVFVWPPGSARTRNPRSKILSRTWLSGPPSAARKDACGPAKWNALVDALRARAQIIRFASVSARVLRARLSERAGCCNVTPERVRQIEAKAILKLSHPSAGRVLTEYRPLDTTHSGIKRSGVSDASGRRVFLGARQGGAHSAWNGCRNRPVIPPRACSYTFLEPKTLFPLLPSFFFFFFSSINASCHRKSQVEGRFSDE